MQDDDVFTRESWFEVERKNRNWQAKAIPSRDDIPVDALTGWAEIPEGLDTDDDGYLFRGEMQWEKK